MASLLHTNTKSVTVHNTCYKTPPSTSLNFATRVWRSRVVRLSLIFTIVYAGSRVQNGNEQLVWCVHLYFVNFAPLSDPTNKILIQLVFWFKQLYLGTYSELDTCSLEIFSHNDRKCHFPPFWLFFLNHPVYLCFCLIFQCFCLILLRFCLILLCFCVIFYASVQFFMLLFNFSILLRWFCNASV